MELLEDPQTIPFTHGSQVDLPKLKNQIDRRILKITAMLRNGQDSSKKSSCLLHKSVQTQSNPTLPPFQSRPSIESNILGSSKKFDPNVHQKQTISLKKKSKKSIDKENLCVKTKERPLREIRPGSILYEEPEFIKQEPDASKPGSLLVQSKGFTFRQVEVSRNQSSIDFQDIQECTDERISDKKDFPMKLSCIEMCGNEYLQNQKYFEFRDNAKSEIGRMSLKTDLSQKSGSTYNKYGYSQKRAPHKTLRKMTQMSLPQPQQRIEVSQSLFEKMKAEVQQLFPRRRKEFWDSKVRLNVLKKIEEKYHRDLYDN